MRKTAQTVARPLFVSLLAVAMISTIVGSAQQAHAAPPDAEEFAARLGNDGGFVFSLLYSGDLNGSLDTCG